MIAASNAVGPHAVAALVGIAVTLGRLRQGRPPGDRGRILLVVAVVNLVPFALAGTVAAILKWPDAPLLAWLERPTTPAPRTPPPPV